MDKYLKPLSILQWLTSLLLICLDSSYYENIYICVPITILVLLQKYSIIFYICVLYLRYWFYHTRFEFYFRVKGLNSIKPRLPIKSERKIKLNAYTNNQVSAGMLSTIFKAVFLGGYCLSLYYSLGAPNPSTITLWRINTKQNILNWFDV